MISDRFYIKILPNNKGPFFLLTVHINKVPAGYAVPESVKTKQSCRTLLRTQHLAIL